MARRGRVSGREGHDARRAHAARRRGLGRAAPRRRLGLGGGQPRKLLLCSAEQTRPVALFPPPARPLDEIIRVAANHTKQGGPLGQASFVFTSYVHCYAQMSKRSALISSLIPPPPPQLTRGPSFPETARLRVMCLLPTARLGAAGRQGHDAGPPIPEPRLD